MPATRLLFLDTPLDGRGGNGAASDALTMRRLLGCIALQELVEVFSIDTPKTANLERVEFAGNDPVVDRLARDAKLFGDSGR
jgi:hypothetical protein